MREGYENLKSVAEFIVRFLVEKEAENKEAGKKRSKRRAAVQQQQEEAAATSQSRNVDSSKDTDPTSMQPSRKRSWVRHCFDPNPGKHGKYKFIVQNGNRKLAVC